jgi:hypothetical protein
MAEIEGPKAPIVQINKNTRISPRAISGAKNQIIHEIANVRIKKKLNSRDESSDNDLFLFDFKILLDCIIIFNQICVKFKLFIFKNIHEII